MDNESSSKLQGLPFDQHFWIWMQFYKQEEQKGHHLYPKNLEQVIVYYGKYGKKKIAIAIATKYS